MAAGVDELDELKHQLDDEEERILKELREIESAQQVRVGGGGGGLVEGGGKGGGGKRKGDVKGTEKVEGAGGVRFKALNAILAECEKEVRDCKGYVAEGGPTLKIVRCRVGEPVPKHATYLSRPKDTGVDFTVPVKVAGYSDIVKNPITLNQIRDKCRHNKYESSEGYLEDMRLLLRNTKKFNATADVQWVVQHAQLLVDAAEDAVKSRLSRLTAAAEESVFTSELTPAPRTPTTPGKRKRELSANGFGTVTHGRVSTGSSSAAAAETAWHGPGKRGRGGRADAGTSHQRRKTQVHEDGLEADDPVLRSEGGKVSADVLELQAQILSKVEETKTHLLGEIHFGQSQIQKLQTSLDDFRTMMISAQGKLSKQVDEMGERLRLFEEHRLGNLPVEVVVDHESPQVGGENVQTNDELVGSEPEEVLITVDSTEGVVSAKIHEEDGEKSSDDEDGRAVDGDDRPKTVTKEGENTGEDGAKTAAVKSDGADEKGRQPQRGEDLRPTDVDGAGNETTEEIDTPSTTAAVVA